jgi:SOS-response transcriptional repressor LexA
LEAYRISGTQFEPIAGDRDIIIIDREAKLEAGKIIACRFNNLPVLGKLRKIDDALYIEVNNRLLKFDNCLMPALVIEIRRDLTQRI